MHICSNNIDRRATPLLADYVAHWGRAAGVANYRIDHCVTCACCEDSYDDPDFDGVRSDRTGDWYCEACIAEGPLAGLGLPCDVFEGAN